MDDAAELQACYLAYRSLLAEGSLRGRLVLLTGGVGAQAAAARIAGAAVLFVESDSARAKAVVRTGACDFVVSSLDEALRILKNEVRRRAAVGVCLLGERELLLAECIERGVQPRLLDQNEATLVARGARVVAWQAALRADEQAVAWRLPTAPLPSMAHVDTLVRFAGRVQDEERTRWLTEAPLVLGRAWQRLRLLPMLAAELESCLDALRTLPAAEHFVLEGNGKQLWPEPEKQL